MIAWTSALMAVSVALVKGSEGGSCSTSEVRSGPSRFMGSPVRERRGDFRCLVEFAGISAEWCRGLAWQRWFIALGFNFPCLGGRATLPVVDVFFWGLLALSSEIDGVDLLGGVGVMFPPLFSVEALLMVSSRAGFRVGPGCAGFGVSAGDRNVGVGCARDGDSDGEGLEGWGRFIRAAFVQVRPFKPA